MQDHKLLPDDTVASTDVSEIVEANESRTRTFLQTPTLEKDQMDTPINGSSKSKKSSKKRTKPRRIRRSMQSEIELRALSTPFEIKDESAAGDFMKSCLLCCCLSFVSVIDLVGFISAVYYAATTKGKNRDDNSSDSDKITDGKVHYLFDPWVYLLIGSLIGLLMCPILLFTHYSSTKADTLSSEMERIYDEAEQSHSDDHNNHHPPNSERYVQQSSESLISESSVSIDIEHRTSEMDNNKSHSDENIARNSHANGERLGFESWKHAVMKRVNYTCLSIFSSFFDLTWSVIGFVLVNELSANEMDSKLLSNIIIIWAVVKCMNSVITLLNFFVNAYCDCESPES